MKRTDNLSDLIFRFFDGELTSDEKEMLLTELKRNEKLKDEFDSVKNIFELRSATRNIKVSEEYLSSILPNFRGKLDSVEKNHSLNPRLVFVVLIIVTALSIFILIPDENEKVITSFSDIPDEELVQHLSMDITDLLQGEKLDSLFRTEIKSEPEQLSYFVFNGDDLDKLYQQNLIAPDDEQEIYTALIDKKF